MRTLHHGKMAGRARHRPREVRLDSLNRFVLVDRRAIYCPTGDISFDELVLSVRTAIARAIKQHALELLVDTRELTGFPVPGMFQRFLAAVEWADIARGRLNLAMIAREEMIHPEKIAVTFAASRGLTSNIFTTAAEARAWLDAVAAGEAGHG